MKIMNSIFKTIIALVLLITLSCSEKDNATILNQQTTKTYNLASKNADNISGTAKFIKNSNGSVTLELDLNNTIDAALHPAHIHFNTAAESGLIALDLNSVNGSTGKSSTTFIELDNGSPINYQDILNFDGYINVHLSATDLGTIIAQADIGQNALSGESVSYNLDEKNSSGISGVAQFLERLNGEALAVLELSGTVLNGNYPAYIYKNDVATTGPIVFTFNNVNGSTGMSSTNLSEFDDTFEFLYEDVLNYSGHVNVHLSATDLTIVAQANIGSNANIALPVIYNVTNSGAGSYVFTGNDLTAESNPDFTFVRGNTYVFNINTPGHPFYLKTIQGNTATNAYSNGVTNNGTDNGTLTFTVPLDAPDTLYYNCEFHAVMTGTITITD